MKRIHITIHGTVQGVSFRSDARFVAKNLQLTGWVRNNANGTVEINAEGEEDKLKELYRWCQRGSRNAQVEKTECEWQPATKEFKQFVVKDIK